MTAFSALNIAVPSMPEHYAALVRSAPPLCGSKNQGGLNTSDVKTALRLYGIDATGTGAALRVVLGRALSDGRIPAQFPRSAWTEYKDPHGRPYYGNTTT
jgi:hypothetical protein